jgi:hypothetical protein
MTSATQARKHGWSQVAELFEPVATEEYFGHFAEQALEAGLIGMEAEKLRLAIEEEASRPRCCTRPQDQGPCRLHRQRPCGGQIAGPSPTDHRQQAESARWRSRPVASHWRRRRPGQPAP